MVTLIIVRNPFDVKKRETVELPHVSDNPFKYFTDEGEWVFGVNGTVADENTKVQDGDCITVCPKVEKKALGLVLSIGLAYFTGGLMAGTILGGLSTGLRIGIAVAASLVGGAIITKLTAPPKMDMSMEQSNTYGWGGARTIMAQGAALATTYGRMRTGGALMARHVVSDGEKQYLNLLFCAGQGELTKIEDVRINDNPIENYKDVELDTRMGTNDQKVIPNFGDTYADQNLSYELNEEWITHRVQGNTADAIEVTISFPQGLYWQKDDGGQTPTYVDLYGQIREVGGEWTSLPLPLESAERRKGYGLKRILDEIKAKIGWANEQGQTPDDGIMGHIRIKEKSTKAMHKTFRIDNLQKGEYEIRFKCHKEGTEMRYANKCYWSQITQILYDDFTYPGKALIGLRALATEQLSGSEPQVTWIQERDSVYVWNPYRREYQSKPADNPAWACYDILHQAQNIDGHFMTDGCPASRIDYDAFKAWADECEKAGFTFNFIYDAPAQLWEALQYPETIGRGKVIMKGTRFSCVYDYASEPVQLFTAANITKDSLQTDYMALSGRANAVEISFMNKAKNYERDVIPVYSTMYDRDDTLQSPAQVELMGCTELEQAYQHGKWFLRNNRYEVRTISFGADVDAIACTIGDVILVQHQVPSWGTGGRIVSVEDKTITLDTDVSMTKHKKYALLVRDSRTDEIRTYDVMAADMTGKAITTATIPAVQVGDVYAFGEVGLAVNPYRIVSIKRNTNDLTRTIVAVEYHEELYAKDNNAPIVPSNHNEYGLNVSRLILNKSANVNKDGTVVCDIHVTWVLPRGRVAREIRVYYKEYGTETYTPFATFNGAETSCTIPAVLTDRNYTVKVVCVDDLGIVGSGIEETVNITGKSLLSAAPNNFTVTQDEHNPSILHMSWTPLAAPDVKGYRLYDDAGTILVDLIQGNTYHYFVLKSGTYNFELKAVDTSGNESEKGAKTSITVTVDANKVEVPNAPLSGGIEMDRAIYVQWEAVGNTYIDFYEVRTNTNAGTKAGLLAQTADIQTTVKLKKRSGQIAIYAHSPLKGYGQPLVLDYNFPAPIAPSFETIGGNVGEFTVKTKPFPRGCIAWRIYVNDEEFETSSLMFTYKGASGVKEVRAALVDCIGVGNSTDTVLVTVKATIPKEYIDREELGLTAIDNTLAGLDERIKTGAETVIQTEIQGEIDGISSRVAQLSDTIDSKIADKIKGVETHITQLSDTIETRVTEAVDGLDGEKIVSRINQTSKTITLDSKYLHITGQTQIDSDVIAKNLQAGSISADKLNVDKLSSISAMIGHFQSAPKGSARLEIRDNLITVYDSNDRLRVKMGVW